MLVKWSEFRGHTDVSGQFVCTKAKDAELRIIPKIVWNGTYCNSELDGRNLAVYADCAL
jgi:hypothetical protein